jgi:hypothetical protein
VSNLEEPRSNLDLSLLVGRRNDVAPHFLTLQIEIQINIIVKVDITYKTWKTRMAN